MNYYPGAGLGIGTAVIGNALGQTYPAGTVIELCKIYGTLLTAEGDPVGSSSSSLVNNNDGTTTIASAWKGVTLTASLTTAQNLSGRVITTERVQVDTNEYGYFEIYIVKGLTAIVSCSAFGRTVAVNTTGQTAIDISGYFI